MGNCSVYLKYPRQISSVHYSWPNDQTHALCLCLIVKNVSFTLDFGNKNVDNVWVFTEPQQREIKQIYSFVICLFIESVVMRYK